MKKIYQYIVFACITCNLNLSAQEVPNGGFEIWESTDIWINNPAGWITDNTEITAPVFPDSSAYSGELCMSLVPDTDGLGVGDAFAETMLDIDYIPETLEFYARWNYVAGQVGVTITFYNETVEIISENWSPTEFQSESDWQLIQMPLPQVLPIITHCVIRCYADVGDLATATISFDDMQFGVLNGINEEGSSAISVGPNPCHEILNIDIDYWDKNNSHMTILDSFGKIVYTGDVENEVNTSTWSNGHYMLVIQSKDKKLQRKFIVQH